jgi:CelD/BcsL family acetyltransferase involved in cellulose biosynthesis
VFVTVASEGGDVLACFPFQTGQFGVADPVGGTLSDYHGIVCRPGVRLGAADVLRNSGLSGWRFDHLLASDPTFAEAGTSPESSPRIDVGASWKEFVENATSKSLITSTDRKARGLARDVGPLRLEVMSDDESAWKAMSRWKSEQYVRTGLPDMMSEEWVQGALRSIWRTRQDGFSGMLTVLHAGDQIAAVHFGMRSHATWHWWFPTYSPEFAKYSPGAILLLEMIKAAPQMGLRWIDLGKGAQTYKDRIATGAVPLLEGVSLRPTVRAYSWKAGKDALHFARTTARAGKRALVRLGLGQAAAGSQTVST